MGIAHIACPDVYDFFVCLAQEGCQVPAIEGHRLLPVTLHDIRVSLRRYAYRILACLCLLGLINTNRSRRTEPTTADRLQEEPSCLLGDDGRHKVCETSLHRENVVWDYSL